MHQALYHELRTFGMLAFHLVCFAFFAFESCLDKLMSFLCSLFYIFCSLSTVTVECEISIALFLYYVAWIWKKFKCCCCCRADRERRKKMDSDHDFDCIAAWHWCLLLCLFSPSFTCHVSRRWSSWGGHTKKLNAWKALCNQEASFNSLSIHYNESQANLRDDDDVHFQRW